MAGGWWYCDCNTEVLQELTNKKPPTHEGETNVCPSCGVTWVAKDVPAGVAVAGSRAYPTTLWWWRPNRTEA